MTSLYGSQSLHCWSCSYVMPLSNYVLEVISCYQPLNSYQLNTAGYFNALHLCVAQPRPQPTSRLYLAAVEKKAWDQNYVTDWNWWTWLVQTEHMQLATSMLCTYVLQRFCKTL